MDRQANGNENVGVSEKSSLNELKDDELGCD